MENNFGQLGRTQEEALAKAQPIVDGILKAQNDGDYEGFCNYFEGSMKDNLAPEDFVRNQQHILETMGKQSEMQFVTPMKRGDLLALVYKCTFDGSPDDFLVTITFNPTSDPLKATGIWIS